MQYNNQLQFPTDSNFINRITGAEFGPSKSSGNPMITVDMEVIAPVEVQIGDQKVTIAGTKTTSYYPTKNLTDAEKSANSLTKVKALIGMLFPENPEYVEQFNQDNPDGEMLKAMVGKCVLTMMQPKVEERRKNATPAQLEEAKKKGINPSKAGDVMKHPVTGKALILYYPEVKEVFGLAPENASAGVPY